MSGPPPQRLSWAVSGRGTALLAVAEACRIGLLNAQIVGVAIDRSLPLAARLADLGIPCYLVDHQASESRAAFDQGLAEALSGSQADLTFLTFNRLIGPDVLAACRRRILNLHMALLPLFPGFGALRAALRSGMRVAGVTIHVVDDTVDGGAIIAQGICPIYPGDTEALLGRRLFETALPLVMQCVRWSASADLIITSDGLPIWKRDNLQMGPRHFPGVDADITAFSDEFCNQLP
ncbi:phosphoribosylglycinamide formyltransferase [Candidatus Raskinella chloraquaticus]|uniref:phosphoribosylglycinamide formyltransferase n=1 Tax=Candidatus Raskinella chloraquaticus TaxID=1951219 RepID=UPI0026BBE07A